MKLLNIGKAQAIGHLELLWHMTAKYAIQGDIGKWTNEQIADACAWDGDADLFIKSLVQSGWLNEHPEYRLVVHDWAEHADQSVRKTLRSRNLPFITGRVAETCEKSGTIPEKDGTIPETFRKSPEEVQCAFPKPKPKPEPKNTPRPRSSTPYKLRANAQYKLASTAKEAAAPNDCSVSVSDCAGGSSVSVSAPDGQASTPAAQSLHELQQRAIACVAKHLGLSTFDRNRAQGTANLTTVCNLVAAIYRRDGPSATRAAISTFEKIAADKAAAKGLKRPMAALVRTIQAEFRLPSRAIRPRAP